MKITIGKSWDVWGILLSDKIVWHRLTLYGKDLEWEKERDRER